MIAHHFGTDEIPRQCVTPGDYVLHEGRTYIASANNIKKRKLYIRNLTTKTCITDPVSYTHLTLPTICSV